MDARRFAQSLCARTSTRLIALLVFLFAGVSLVSSQQITGTLSGTVNDSQGALVTTATVKATNTSTGYSRSAPVSSDGTYLIQYLPVGSYTVQVDAAGFKRFVQQNVVISLDQTQSLPVTLQVGAQSETVTVTTAPPVVNTSDAELGRTIPQSEVSGMPLVNRNAYSELNLVPGVQSNSMSQQSNPNGTPDFVIGLPSTQVQINGSIDGGNPEVSFYLDGGSNVTGIRNYGLQLPNPDALEEFRVETSNFSAEYGHMSAAVITAVTKSGTNKFHGSLFEFNRNTDFNAYPWNAPTDSQGRFINAPYHRNQFGGVIGGPVKRDKAFFLFSYGGLRQVVGQYVHGGRVPTDAERMGDFTADLPSAAGSKVSVIGSTPFVVNMPGTKTPLTGYTNSGPGCTSVGVNPSNPNNENCIPASMMDAIATAVAPPSTGKKNPNAYIPEPNLTQTGVSVPTLWDGYYTGPTNEDEYLGKYDQNLGNSDHVAVTYFFVKTTQDAFGGGNIAPWSINRSYTNQTNADVSDVHTFGANTANQAWLTFTRAAGGRVNLPTTNAGQLGSTYTIQGPSTLPDLNVSGYFRAQNSLAGPVTTSDYYSLRDMVSMTKGKHNLVYGGELALDKGMFWGNLYNYGNFTYTKSAPTTTGDALPDFFTGMLSSMEQDTPYQTLTSAWHTAIFLQDNYRIKSNLTLNLGVRWDLDTPPVESRDHTATFDPRRAALTSDPSSTGTVSTKIPVAPPGMFFPGDSGVPRGIITMKYHHLAPRIGFAWDPWGDGKTAIRAGAGLFYGTTSGNEWNQPGNANPYAVRQTFNSVRSASDPYNPLMVNGKPSAFPNGDPFPYVFDPKNPRFLLPASIESIAQNVQWPYIYQFNLAVQRQLPGAVSLTAAYVGTLSHDVPTMIDGNYAPYAPGATTSESSINSRRPYDQNATGTGTLAQNIFLISNQTANFHSLQIVAGRPLTHNLMLNGYYVWSHALQSSNESAIGQMTAQDFANLWEERGAMTDDRRNVASISGMWNIDYYRGSNFFMKQVVNGWTISPIVSLQSGTPLEVTTGANNNKDSSNHNRPNLVPGVSAFYSPNRSRQVARNAWFNKAAFTPNGPGLPGGIGPYGADGNTPRDYLRAPGYSDIDLGIFRNFNLVEGIVFQIRGEATNAFNMVSLSGPGTNLSSSTVGVITSASSSRIIQVGARLTF
jgi:hypothetical protein